MCGRFTQSYSWAEVHSFLTLVGAPQNLRPRYNVAPSQQVAVGRDREERGVLKLRTWLDRRSASQPAVPGTESPRRRSGAGEAGEAGG